MKRLFLPLALLTALLIGSCSKSFNVEDNISNTKICDYLYGVEYDDYDFNKGVEAMEQKFKPLSAACSEVRKGNFVGRNLDWYINRDASAVIKVNGKEGRNASIGVVGCFTPFSNEFAASGQYGEAYDLLPLFTVDGINEKGVYIGVNVCPTGETSFDQGSWKYGEWGHGAAFTHPTAKETFCVTYLTRVILDRATSVDNAKEIINGINWYEPDGFPHEGESQSFHWLICDMNKSAVLEFIDNKAYFTETTVINKPSYSTIMTNFTNKLMNDRCLVQTHGMGYERWDTLAEKYEKVSESYSGMEDLMKSVWYSKCYTTEVGSHNYMLTDFSSDEFPAYYLYKHYEYWEDQYLLDNVAHLKEVFNDRSKWHTDDCQLWYTTHTSLYDIKNKELKVMVHEGFDGQKTFFTVDFDSKFVKPLEHR